MQDNMPRLNCITIIITPMHICCTHKGLEEGSTGSSATLHATTVYSLTFSSSDQIINKATKIAFLLWIFFQSKST